MISFLDFGWLSVGVWKASSAYSSAYSDLILFSCFIGESGICCVDASENTSVSSVISISTNWLLRFLMTAGDFLKGGNEFDLLMLDEVREVLEACEKKRLVKTTLGVLTGGVFGASIAAGELSFSLSGALFASPSVALSLGADAFI